jgi:hypothetical protein
MPPGWNWGRWGLATRGSGLATRDLVGAHGDAPSTFAHIANCAMYAARAEVEG